MGEKEAQTNSGEYSNIVPSRRVNACTGADAERSQQRRARPGLTHHFRERFDERGLTREGSEASGDGEAGVGGEWSSEPHLRVRGFLLSHHRRVSPSLELPPNRHLVRNVLKEPNVALNS